MGYTPHEGQLEIHRSTAPRRIVACGVRWGKTYCSAMEGVVAALQPAEHAVIWIVAPTYDLCDRVFSRIALTFLQHFRSRVVVYKEHERRLVIRNMSGGLSEVRGKSADNTTSLLGEGVDFLIVDEAGRLRSDVWESHLSQRLLDKGGSALMISTPHGKNYFYGLFQRGQGRDPIYQSWNLPSSSSPLLDLAAIEGERQRLPDAVFRQEYEAQFVEGAGAVFRYVTEAAIGEFQPPQSGERYVAGLDLARIEDFSVLTILNTKRQVVFIDRFGRVDWGLQAVRVKAACDRYNRAKVLVDATGVGDPVLELLRKTGVYAEPFQFTQKSKSDLVSHLALLLEQKKLVIPRREIFPVLCEELEAFEYSSADGTSGRMGAPYGMHDDTVISLALGLWHLRTHAGRPLLIRSASSMRGVQRILRQFQ